jgi:hypothetical protein
MSHLRARKNFGYNIEPIELTDIITGDIDIVDYIEDNKPTRLPRFYYLCYQIKLDNFIYNPLPLLRVDNTLRYQGGMLRLMACIELDYHSIDSIVLNSKEEVKDLIKRQQMMTREYFPKRILEPTETI